MTLLCLFLLHRMNPTLSGQIDQISPPPIVKHVLCLKMAKKAFEKNNGMKSMTFVRPPTPPWSKFPTFTANLFCKLPLTLSIEVIDPGAYRMSLRPWPGRVRLPGNSRWPTREKWRWAFVPKIAFAAKKRQCVANLPHLQCQENIVLVIHSQGGEKRYFGTAFCMTVDNI